MLCITHLGLLRQAPSSAGSSEKAKQETSLHGTLKLMKGRAVSELCNIMDHLLAHSSYPRVWLIVSVQTMITTLIAIIVTIIF